MDLIEEIRALPAELLAQKDTAAIAAALSEGRTRVVSTLIGTGTVLDTFGPVRGAEVMGQLKALGAEETSPFYWAVDMLRRVQLDIGRESTRGMVLVLQRDGFFTAEEAAALLALAVESAPVGELAVRQVCYSADGKWII